MSGLQDRRCREPTHDDNVAAQISARRHPPALGNLPEVPAGEARTKLLDIQVNVPGGTGQVTPFALYDAGTESRVRRWGWPHCTNGFG